MTDRDRVLGMSSASGFTGVFTYTPNCNMFNIMNIVFEYSRIDLPMNVYMHGLCNNIL